MNVLKSESILTSALAKKAPYEANKIHLLWKDAQKLHAREGARRLELICTHYDALSPEKTYSWIDPVGFQHEVEEAIALRWHVRYGHIARNCLSVLPLIMTWLALYTATAAYPLDTFRGDAGKSFLQLWQEGFHGTIVPFLFFKIPVITFSGIAALDVAFLLLYFIVIAYTSWRDSLAYAESTKFAKGLQIATEELMTREAHISENQTPGTNLAVALQLVLTETVTAREQMMKTNQEAIKIMVETMQASVNAITDRSKEVIMEVNAKSDTLYRQHIMPMVNEFSTNMGKLLEQLTLYQERLDKLTNASQQLADASNALGENAETYQKTGEVVSENIAELNKTQHTVLDRIQVIADGVTKVAEGMSQTATAMGEATGEVKKVAEVLQQSLGTLDKKVEATMSTTLDGVKSTTEALLIGMQEVVNTTTERVGGATSALRDVGPDLNSAVTTFDEAVTRFAQFKAAQNGRDLNGNGHLFSEGIFFRFLAWYRQNRNRRN